MESEWAMFKASIVEAASLSCGRKVVGACRGGNLRKEAIRLKKEAFQAWLDHGSPEAANRSCGGYWGCCYEPSGPYPTKVGTVSVFSAQSQACFKVVVGLCRVVPCL